jgi:hypothetical protein
MAVWDKGRLVGRRVEGRTTDRPRCEVPKALEDNPMAGGEDDKRWSTTV